MRRNESRPSPTAFAGMTIGDGPSSETGTHDFRCLDASALTPESGFLRPPSLRHSGEGRDPRSRVTAAGCERDIASAVGGPTSGAVRAEAWIPALADGFRRDDE